MNLFERAESIFRFLSDKINTKPDYAIILGSGLGAFADIIEKDFEIEYKDIPHFPKSTVTGHKGKLIFGTICGKNVVAMQGRIHLYEGYDIGEVTIPVMLFHLLGVKNLIVTNAAGGVNETFSPKDLMVITDHISLFCPTPLTVWHKDGLGDRFPSMNNVYSERLINSLLYASNDCKIPLKSGVYCYLKGPAYETPAEIKMLKTCGADAVGMSTVPEVILAKYLDMNILGISCITNMAAGIVETPPSHQEVIDNSKAIEDNFCELLLKFFEIV